MTFWVIWRWLEVALIVFVALRIRREAPCPWCGSRVFYRWRRRTYDLTDNYRMEVTMPLCDACMMREGSR